MFITRMVGHFALRRKAMCSLKWRQLYCSLERQMNIALLRRVGAATRGVRTLLEADVRYPKGALG